MPIQFRCGSCQQLLGIARRKAGAIVDCPTCHQKTRVPIVKEHAPSRPAAVKQGTQPASIFDRVDVEKLLQPQVVAAGVAPALHPGEHQLPPLPDPLEEAKPTSAVVTEEPGLGDEPFTLTAAALPRAPASRDWLHGKTLWFILGGLILIAAGFLVGHWFGAHRPLF